MNTLFLILSSFTWFVSFTDKQGSTEICLSERALELRDRWNIAIDSLDYEVSPIYLDSLRAHGLTVMMTSRWMNGATVTGTAAQIQSIDSLPFVQYTELTRSGYGRGANSPGRLKRTGQQYTPAYIETATVVSDAQLALYNLTPLHELGFQGQDILMTVCDGGFYNSDIVSGLQYDSLCQGWFDFTDDGTDIFRSPDGRHGTSCLSCIVGKRNNYKGAATNAKYYLMRSEEANTESPKEADNWISAVEKCDSLGVQVMSTSLGYFYFDNSSWDWNYQMMNGQTVRASRAATIAARKGMLIVVAAGNEGSDSWHYISVPADADSILTVGAVDSQGDIAPFSSYGPTYDGRIKPEACAVGWSTYLFYADDGSIYTSNGTSFACPLLAGMAASLWSALPSLPAQTIRQLIIESGSYYDQPDAHYGYGIPDAYRAYLAGLQLLPTEELTLPYLKNIRSEKVLIHGQIRVRRGNKLYDLLGNIVQ